MLPYGQRLCRAKTLCGLQVLRPTGILMHCWSWVSKKLMSSVCFWFELLNIKKGNMSGLPGWLNSVISSPVRFDLEFCDYFSVIDLPLTFSMRFEGAPHMLGVLNHSSRCMLVLGGMQCASVNLLCCLTAPRLVGAFVQLYFGTLSTWVSSTQASSVMRVCYGSRCCCCSGELPRKVCGRGAKVVI